MISLLFVWLFLSSFVYITSIFLLIKNCLSVQDGSILAWKFNAATNNFEPVTCLKGHSLAVVSLVVGANRLYSGSMDNSIKASCCVINVV